MKKTFYVAVLLLISAVYASAQSPFRIQAKCQPPNASTYGSITVVSSGDIRQVPCPSRSNIFIGNVDFSGATVTFGTFSANRFLGATQSAALPTFSFTSDPDTGFYREGVNQIGVSTGGVERWMFSGSDFVNNSGGAANIISGAGDLGLQGGDNINITASLGTTIIGGNNALLLNAGSTSTLQTLQFSFGDLGSIGNDTTFALDDIAETITASVNAGTTQMLLDGGANNVTFPVANTFGVSSQAYNLDASGTASLGSTGNFSIRAGTTAGVSINAATSAITLGDLTFAGSVFSIDDTGSIDIFGATGVVLGSSGQSLRVVQGSDTLRSTLATWDMGPTGGAGFGVTNYLYNRTITAGGTTGAQVINLPAGTVNFAAGAGVAGLVVTNSTATANSIVHATARTNDATCSVKAVVSAAGSFTIFMTANCTAETSVGFLVTN